tara:strand:+ start:247 stop:441 length:195 start_codon:yes stop_codon:yes gene_type:complete
MANYTKIPGVPRPNWVVKYTSSVGNKIRMCFIHEENMKEWIAAVTELNKMSGTEFNYVIEEAVD